MTTPCCYIPTKGTSNPYSPSLMQECIVFNDYVAGIWPLPAKPRFTSLISALHLDIVMWQTAKPLSTKKYKINNARHNSFAASVVRGSPSAKIGQNLSPIFNSLDILPNSKKCRLPAYDGWLLGQTLAIRSFGKTWHITKSTSLKKSLGTLTTVGMSQKLINLYYKYQFCWAASGSRLNLNPGKVLDFSCALHCPLDRIFLLELMKLPLGQDLKRRGLLTSAKGSPAIRNLNGHLLPWSKLDCISTYYSLQMVLRRLAMMTWPKGCACLIGNPTGLKNTKISVGEAIRQSGESSPKFEEGLEINLDIDQLELPLIAPDWEDLIFGQNLTPFIETLPILSSPVGASTGR